MRSKDLRRCPTQSRPAPSISSTWSQDVINSPLKLPLALVCPVDIETLSGIAPRRWPCDDYLAIQGPDALGAHRLDGFGVELKLLKRNLSQRNVSTSGAGLRLSAATAGYRAADLPAHDEEWQV